MSLTLPRPELWIRKVIGLAASTEPMPPKLGIARHRFAFPTFLHRMCLRSRLASRSHYSLTHLIPMKI